MITCRFRFQTACDKDSVNDWHICERKYRFYSGMKGRTNDCKTSNDKHYKEGQILLDGNWRLQMLSNVKGQTVRLLSWYRRTGHINPSICRAGQENQFSSHRHLKTLLSKCVGVASIHLILTCTWMYMKIWSLYPVFFRCTQTQRTNDKSPCKMWE